jgi:ABC-type Fe3+-hydroxamate transport system substrate-binding protein
MKNVAITCVLFLLIANASAAAARVLHDELGREVRVPDHPHRLVCLAPSITETVYELGFGAKIVGITDYTRYPPEAAAKPSVGGVINPSFEKLASLKPDLVLAIGDLNSSELVHSIEELGIPVFVIDPHGVEGIYRSILSVGNAINQTERAARLVAELRARAEAVRKRVAGMKRPSVFFLLWADPIITAGHGAFITQLIEMAGGNSITKKMPGEWPRLNLETLVSMQPEYVLVVRDSGVSVKLLKEQPGWQNLQAIAKGRVLLLDDRINFPSPVALDALQDLAKQLHP